MFERITTFKIVYPNNESDIMICNSRARQELPFDVLFVKSFSGGKTDLYLEFFRLCVHSYCHSHSHPTAVAFSFIVINNFHYCLMDQCIDNVVFLDSISKLPMSFNSKSKAKIYTI